MKTGTLSAAMALLLLPANAFALPPEQETEHVVSAGETLNGIANRAGVKRDRIIKANGLEPPYLIRIGQKLEIPRDVKTASRSNAARPAPQPSLTKSNSHIVQPGETLGGIAVRAEVPRILIAEANGLSPPYNIRPGQKLMLPRTRRHTVENGDTGFGIAYEYGVPWGQIAIANGLDSDAPLVAGKTLLIPTMINVPQTTQTTQTTVSKPATTSNSRFAWPVSGPLRRKFTARGTGDHHDGWDIGAPLGTAVRAASAGKVIFARPESKEFGNLVIIDHGQGWHSAYGSLGRITVKKGHTVTKGERIGLVGNTSVTRRAELHFELRKDGKPVDPAGKLPATP